MTLTFSRDNILSCLSFEEAGEADCWDHDEGTENVRFESVIDALASMLDSSMLPVTGDVREWLDTNEEFLHLQAYKRDRLSDAWVDEETDYCIEWMRERFSEEYGDQDGDDRLSNEDFLVLKDRMREAVSFYVEHVKVYRVDMLREWKFDRVDVLELVQQLRPDWLDPAVDTGARSGEWRT